MADSTKVIKCSSCGKLIARGFINDGTVEIKCKCGVVNTVSKEPKEKELRKDNNLPENKLQGITLGIFSIEQMSE